LKIKIDFVAPPFSGHLNPLIELARPLLHKNFKIRFITGSQKAQMLRDMGFQAIALLSDRPDIMENIANTAKPVGNNPILLSQQLRENLAILPRVKQELELLLTQNHTDIVVADFVAVPMGIVCEEKKIPWITVMPTPFALETKQGTPSYLGGLTYGNSYVTRMRDRIGRKIVRSFKWFVGCWFRQELKVLNFQIYRPDGSERAYSPHAILGLGLASFEFIRDWPKHFKFIGPCCFSPEIVADLEIPFTQYEKAVLVSLGTHLEWAKNNLVREVEFLAACFPKVLFVISFGRSHKICNNMDYQKDNVMAFPYIPYSQYLSRFDAVIHHGGAGITYSCIKYKKPCLVVPHDYDQFDFAARIEYNRIGLKVKRMGSAEAVEKLTDVLADNRLFQLQVLNHDMEEHNPSCELEAEIYRLLHIELQ